MSNADRILQKWLEGELTDDEFAAQLAAALT